MNDDELVERLRRTLHAEADALTPGRGAPRVSARRHRRVRSFGLPHRAVAALAAAAVVIVAVAVAVDLRHGPHTDVSVIGPAARATRGDQRQAGLRTGGRPRRRAPVTTAPASTAPAVTVPAVTPTTAPSAPAGQPVVRLGTAFVPLSVTFESAATGWILGVAPCGSGACLQIARTDDHGQTWDALTTAPAATGLSLPSSATTSTTPALQIRFANLDDGWVYGNLDGSPVVWATEDGGATWIPESLPGAQPGSRLDALETADGHVAAVVATSGHTFVVDTSGLATYGWTTATTITAGAGGEARASLVLQGPGGWVVGVDGTTVSGAELQPDGTWTAWTPPCARTGGTAVLAASTPTSLVAVCDEQLAGTSTAADAPTGITGSFERVWGSVDGGSTFQPDAVIPAADAVSAIASPDPSTIVGIGSAAPGSLIASTDGGTGWRTVYDDPAATIVQVGFEDSTQGVAVTATSSGGSLLMTADGGQTWSSVDLQA